MANPKHSELLKAAGAVMTEKLEWGMKHGGGALMIAEVRLMTLLKEFGWEPPSAARCACGRAEEICPGCGKPWCPACCAPCGTGLSDA